MSLQKIVGIIVYVVKYRFLICKRIGEIIMGKNVFISHSSYDKEVVKIFSELIKKYH